MAHPQTPANNPKPANANTHANADTLNNADAAGLSRRRLLAHWQTLAATGLAQPWLRWTAGSGLAAALTTATTGCQGHAAADPNQPLTIALPGRAQTTNPYAVTDAVSMRWIEPTHRTLFAYPFAHPPPPEGFKHPEQGGPKQATGGETSRSKAETPPGTHASSPVAPHPAIQPTIQPAIQPDLATAWHWADTPAGPATRLTLTLDPTARFHHGPPVTSRDVQASLQTIQQHGVRARHLQSVAEVQTPDARTVVLLLHQTNAALLTNLAHPMHAILPAEQLANRSPGDCQGCGFFKRAAANNDPNSTPTGVDHGVFVRHAKSTDSASHGNPPSTQPTIDRLAFRAMPDATARLTAVRTGETDWVHGLTPKGLAILAPSGRSQKQATDEHPVHLPQTPGTFWEYVGINCRNGALANRSVRQALAWGLDRDRLNQAIKFGRATPLPGGHIPPNHWAHAKLNTYPKQNLARAAELLKTIGVGPGMRSLSLSMKVDATQSDQVQAAEMIKQFWRPLSVDLTIQALEPALFYPMLNRGDFELTLVGWMGFVDPDEWVADLFHSQGAYNQQGHKNAQVDQWIADGVATQDRAARQRIYAKIQQQIVDDAPMLFLYINPQSAAAGPRLAHCRPHPTASLRPVFGMQ